MAGSSRGGGDPVLSALRSVRPARAVLVSSDGEERELALRTGATRWQHCASTARAMAADDDGARLELRDAKGAVLAAIELVERAEPAAEPEPATSGDLDRRDERVLTLLVSAQKAALEEQRVLLGPVLESYTALAAGYAQYAAQVVELVRLASSLREEQAAATPSPADAALVSLLGQVGARANGAQKA